MRTIPKALRDKLAHDPFMRTCIREREGTCQGRITFEHAMLHAGRQVNEQWAIVPLCASHHLTDAYERPYGQWVALNRATDADLAKYPRNDWQQLKKHLNKIYDNL